MYALVLIQNIRVKFQSILAHLRSSRPVRNVSSQKGKAYRGMALETKATIVGLFSDLILQWLGTTDDASGKPMYYKADLGSSYARPWDHI